MNRQKMLSYTLAATLAFLSASPLLAKETEAVTKKPKPVSVDIPHVDRATTLAKRCEKMLIELANKGCRHSKRTAKRAIYGIKKALAAGDHRRAAKIARHGTNKVRKDATRCAKAISGNARRCIRVLRYLKRPDLAKRIRHVRAEQLKRLRKCASRAEQAITSALPSIRPVEEKPRPIRVDGGPTTKPGQVEERD